jgi:hypothetical protein
VLFIHLDKDNSKTWEIKIPLSSIMIERWRIEEESRRKQVAAGGSSLENIGFGAGVIHETGKAHHIIIPYMDENGIPQEPRFGISSFQGRAIREWASQFYDQVVNVKKEKTRTDQESTATFRSQTPIGVSIIAQSNQNKSIIASSNSSTTNIVNPTINENKDGRQMIGPPTPTSSSLSQPSIRIRTDPLPSQKHVTESEQNNISKDSDVGELVKVLKLRLVKGEITKEEFIELRRLVEDKG